MKTGLVSVTFRKLDVLDIIKLVHETGLDGIEWGSDIHVPVGDIEKAKYVASLMKQYNLETISYGSYYRCTGEDDFSLVLETAKALNTTNIRVWAGRKNSEEFSESEKEDLILNIQNICKQAQEYNMTVSFEYHGKTFTNTQKSTLELLEKVKMDNNYTYWQPLANADEENKLINVKRLYSDKKLMNIHAYHWDKDGTAFMLNEALDLWKKRIENIDCNAILLEFVKDGTVENYYKDVNTLKEILK